MTTRNDWTQGTKLLLIIGVGGCIYQATGNVWLSVAASLALFTFA